MLKFVIPKRSHQMAGYIMTYKVILFIWQKNLLFRILKHSAFYLLNWIFLSEYFRNKIFLVKCPFQSNLAHFGQFFCKDDCWVVDKFLKLSKKVAKKVWFVWQNVES